MGKNSVRACLGGGRFPRTPFAVPKKRFDGESALCSEDHVRLISHKPAATRLDLPGLASTLGTQRLSSSASLAYASSLSAASQHKVFG